MMLTHGALTDARTRLMEVIMKLARGFNGCPRSLLKGDYEARTQL